MLKKVILSAALVLVIAAVIVYGLTRIGLTKKKPIRIVLIIFDTLRYDTLMGSDEQETAMPITRAFANQGLIFTRFYSATSSTQPSHATKFTALHPWQHGVSRNGQVLAEKYTTIAEVLKENGFSTSAVVASFPVSRKMGFAQGFHRYRQGSGRGKTLRDEYAPANKIAEAAIEQIETAQGKKQFFWFHFFDVYAPYGNTTGVASIIPRSLLIKAVAEGKSYEELKEMVGEFHKYYDGDAEYLDKFVSQIFERLKADADRFETHILVTSDHGESFGEDGSVAHGKRVTPWQIHVPCFIVSPKVKPGVCNGITSSIDIMATVLSLAGVEYEVPAGRDLTTKLTGLTYAFGMRRTFYPPFREVRLDGRTYVHDYNLFYVIYPDGRIFRGNRDVLFDTLTGAESVSKDLVAYLHALFGQFEDKLKGVESTELTDDKTIQALKTLGYIH